MQSDWRWCHRCQGMFFSGGAPSVGICPAGGRHENVGSGNYTLIHNSPGAQGQSDWRWCHKCQGLFFARGGPVAGVCPGGGQHEKGWSGDYTLAHNSPGSPGQSDWRWCHKCEGMFFSGGKPTAGVCPAGSQHVKGSSGDYTPMHTAESVKPSAEVFRDPSLAGASTRLMLPSSTGDHRYDLKRFADISPAGLFHAISSARITRSGSDCERSLYLFGGSSTTIPNTDLRRHVPYTLLNARAPLPFIQDFHGDFLRVTLRAGGASGEMVVNDLASHSFGDRATSIMLVDRWRDGKPETTISASDTFTFGWKTALAGIIPVVQFALGGGVAIAQIGDPVFTWVAFPPATPNLPNNFTYLVLSQWFVFHASGIGVNAWLMLYLRLSRDNGGKLVLNVVELDRYVWPGTGQGQMMNAIDGAKAGILSAISNGAGLILGALAQVRCDDVYLLPGKQPNTKAALDGIVLQDAMSDVTIVLENQH